ncbi:MULTISPECIES: cytidine deaminase [unclassified Carboxylicivirga]|uniref:cytidine deaminase n=1 Tax=Carboxylicivirga TaxID=1628153 RepID=UPI003D329BCE
MKKISINVPIEVYESAAELMPYEQDLTQAAEEACKTAYAPFSKFRVGAAVLLENGKVITGSNQENAAYPSGLCAERVALFYANAQYPDTPVKAIAIAASNANGFIETPVAPCGACRQVMLQTELRFGAAYDILLVGKQAINKLKSCKDLLPLTFEGKELI